MKDLINFVLLDFPKTLYEPSYLSLGILWRNEGDCSIIKFYSNIIFAQRMENVNSTQQVILSGANVVCTNGLQRHNKTC